MKTKIMILLALFVYSVSLAGQAEKQAMFENIQIWAWGLAQGCCILSQERWNEGKSIFLRWAKAQRCNWLGV